MTPIARITLDEASDDALSLPWDAVARKAQGWLHERGCAVRDTVVLVPYAALIEPVRAAFARQPGWQPRVETALTLAASLGPADGAGPGQCSGDAALDRLQAARWLARRAVEAPVDPAQAAALMAEAAAAFAQAAAEQPPEGRAGWQAALLDELPAAPEGSPGAFEALLLRAAAAWAATAPAPATDRLFALQPAAWLVLRLGGADRLAEAVLSHSVCSGAVIDLDPPADDPFQPWVQAAQPALFQADDFESEALATAAQVLQSLARGDGRIALVALDRSLVRRVVSLLLHAGVEVDDETGWKLSTTSAAGRVLARLRAALPGARADDRLDWLKRWTPATARPQALQALETQWRNGRNARLSQAQAEAAQALWADAEPRLGAWQALGEGRTLHVLDALALLQRQLNEDGETAELAADTAGARLLQALQAAASSPAWTEVLQATPCDLPGFVDWFETLCESITVQRDPRPGSRVVLTPLARAVGRPFAHVVVAGADASRLGRDAGGPALVSDALAARLGLPTAEQRRQRVRLALAQLLRVPRLTLLWRRLDGDAPQSPAQEVEWLRDSWQRAGRPLPVEVARLPVQTIPPAPVSRPLPTGGGDLPLALSASAVEALRQCPYRFFARSVLRLSESDEVDAPLRKRDYGDWLHATLHHFHVHRRPGQDDRQALAEAAEAVLPGLGLDAAELLAFRASLLRLLPAYLAWLATHEADGWAWQAGEDSLAAAPAAWAPQTLRGRIDRVDQGRQSVRMVIDYKTGQAQGLRQKIRAPLEDTQLPFYVALLQGQPDGSGAGPLRAAYLALDESEGPLLLEHPDVEGTAAVMLEQLGAELQRLRDGASMPALGEGSPCETCEARGLCRRDEWPAVVQAEGPSP